QPRYAFFGHVHNPLARRVRVGRTERVNVGHFRATRPPYATDLYCATQIATDNSKKPRALAGESYAASMSEQPGSDPFGDFQRWLMKAGARSITRDVTDRVKSTMGGGRQKAYTDVWDEATTTDPTD